MRNRQVGMCPAAAASTSHAGPSFRPILTAGAGAGAADADDVAVGLGVTVGGVGASKNAANSWCWLQVAACASGVYDPQAATASA